MRDPSRQKKSGLEILLITKHAEDGTKRRYLTLAGFSASGLDSCWCKRAP
jgi:hypothetical protein